MVIFADIRGFTSWCQHIDVFEYLEEFLAACYTSVTTAFHGAFIKTLGDGAMIIEECAIPTTEAEVEVLLTSVLAKITQVELDFRRECDMFTIQHGHATTLRLGWGVVRGVVNVLSRADVGIVDYIGPNLNKCARLCYIARPAGIVIDREDFPMLPRLPEHPGAHQGEWEGPQTFQAEDHRVNGIVEPIPVWTLLSTETLRM